jgi:RNA polymerase sigma-70 factor (ECF subfamily)
MKNLSDLEIIKSVRNGNSTDYSIIIDRYKNKAFSLLKRMLKNNMEAEEVLQDCFLKAFRGLDSFKGESKFSTWFYRIVYNTALTRISQKKRKIENEMNSIDEYITLQSKNDYNESERKDLSEFINKLVEQLPSKYSSVLNLFYLEGMSCEEISEVMDTSVANVKVLLHRSRNALKDIVLKKNYRGIVMMSLMMKF